MISGALSFELLDGGARANSSTPFRPLFSMQGLDAGDFDGDTWFFEIVARNEHVSLPYAIRLVDGDGTTKATITVPANVPLPTIYRSDSFALTAGLSIYQIDLDVVASSGVLAAWAARMLASLTAATKAVAQFPLTTQGAQSTASGEGWSLSAYEGNTARFDVTPTDGNALPENFGIFLYTADHWSTIAACELEIITQLRGFDDTPALAIFLYDRTAAAEVDGTRITVTVPFEAPARSTVSFAPAALVDGHEYEARGIYTYDGEDSGTDCGALYKARLNFKLTDLAKAESYFLVGNESREDVGDWPLNESRIHLAAGTIYVEAVAKVTGAIGGDYFAELRNAGAAASGDNLTGVEGSRLTFTPTKARVRSGPMVVPSGNYTWAQAQANNEVNETFSGTMALALVTLGTVAPVANEIVACPVTQPVLSVPFSFDFAATGGTPPFSWAVLTGELPPGLDLDPGTGIVSGTPTAAGIFPYRLQVTDAAAVTDSIDCTFTVIAAVPITVPTSCPTEPLVWGTPFSLQFEAEGGTPPYTWEEYVGIPPGLAIAPAGLLSGVPGLVGEYAMQLIVSDAIGDSAEIECVMEVRAPSGTSQQFIHRLEDDTRMYHQQVEPNITEEP